MASEAKVQESQENTYFGEWRMEKGEWRMSNSDLIGPNLF